MAALAARPCAAKLSSKSFNGVSLKSANRPVALAATRKVQPVQMMAATLDVKKVDGAASGSVTLDVKTAGANSAGLVHKYVVMTQQNARRVSTSLHDMLARSSGWHASCPVEGGTAWS